MPLMELATSALKFGLVVGLLGLTGFTGTVIAAANNLPKDLIEAGSGHLIANPGSAMDSYCAKAGGLGVLLEAKWAKDKADMAGSSIIGAIGSPTQAINMALERLFESILLAIVYIVAGLSACVGFVVYLFALLALDIVLALTPIAIACTLWTQTRWLFQGWLSQTLNYVLLIVIVSIITGIIIGLNDNLMSNIVGVSTTSGVAGQIANVATNGATVVLASATEVTLAFVLIIIVYILGTLFFMQAPNIASGIAGGSPSGGHNFMGAVANRVAGQVARAFRRGGPTTRSASRNSVSRR